MSNHLRSLMRIFPLVAGLIIIFGCENIKPASPPTVWIIALDVTPSIPVERFRIMRDEMIARLILSRIRRRDEVYILTIDTDPEEKREEIPLMRVGGPQVGLAKEIANIFDRVHRIEQPQRYKGWTNIGGALAYAKRTAAIAQKTPRPARVVLLAFTDGKREGPQTSSPGEWPDNLQVWFWGVGREYEEPLRKWVTTERQLRPERCTIVRFSDWQSMAGVFGQAVGRPFQDEQVLAKVLPEYIAHRQ